MKPRLILPPASYLHECFIYNPQTGDLIWKKRPKEHFANDGLCKRQHTRWAGTIAGRNSYQGYSGKAACVYVSFHMNGRMHQFVAHRIVLTMHGVDLPDGTVVDHIDGNPFNNRMDNLRVCSHAENLRNSVPYSRKSANSLPKGVYFIPKRRNGRSYRAVLKAHKGGKNTHLGYFSTPQEAHEVWKKAAEIQNGEFFRAS